MGTIFSTNDIRGRIDESLTVEYAWTIGKAFAEWLPDDGVVVAVKTADANGPIAHALTEGVLLQGRDVIDAGQGDQLAIVNAIRDNQAVGGYMISHDSLENMGIITLFDRQGVTITAERGLMDIEELITAGNFLPAAEKGTIRTQ